MYGDQTIIEPEESVFTPDPPSYADTYFHLAAGIYVPLWQNQRLIFGYRWHKHRNKNGRPIWISDILVQLDLVL
jgi:hypothetical protein